MQKGFCCKNSKVRYNLNLPHQRRKVVYDENEKTRYTCVRYYPNKLEGSVKLSGLITRIYNNILIVTYAYMFIVI